MMQAGRPPYQVVTREYGGRAATLARKGGRLTIRDAGDNQNHPTLTALLSAFSSLRRGLASCAVATLLQLPERQLASPRKTNLKREGRRECRNPI